MNIINIKNKVFEVAYSVTFITSFFPLIKNKGDNNDDYDTNNNNITLRTHYSIFNLKPVECLFSVFTATKITCKNFKHSQKQPLSHHPDPQPKAPHGTEKNTIPLPHPNHKSKEE
jgi:hypothetical protein